MDARLLRILNRLEALSLRERVIALVGVPVLLVVLAEGLVFDPARTRAIDARKQAELQQTELKGLSDALAAQSTLAVLPRADQLQHQRDELKATVDAARAVSGGLDRSLDWGTVVRETLAATSGLTLTQLKALPAEVVFASAAAKPAAAARPGAARVPAAAASAVAAAPASETLYRHRAELTVKGEFGALLRYLHKLQDVPGELRWDKLQLSVATYPQASVQLTLFTLSNRPETPFN